MKFHIVTIFPEFFRGPFEHGVIQKAREAGLIEIHVHPLRFDEFANADASGEQDFYCKRVLCAG